MKKVIKVNIPEPCHEDWSKMTTTEKGAFCKVCTKEVVDFTKAIDEDIVKYVMKNNNACGRFSKSQLDRDLTLERSAGKKLAPLAASLLLPLTMMSSSLASPKQGATKINTYTSLGIGSLHKEADRIPIIVKGNITDDVGDALSNVKIIVKETGQETTSDSNGNYSIYFSNQDTLQYSKDGFEGNEHQFGNHNETFNLEMKLEMYNHQIMGEMMAPEISIEEEKKAAVKKSNDNLLNISGIITDEAGLPLPGANVIVKGTTIGTQSDFDGNYNIEVPENSILMVSYIGFTNQEITVSNIDNTFNISMGGSDWMGEIVITGGIGYTETTPIPFTGKTKYRYNTQEEDERKAKRKKRSINIEAFKKIKLAREKEARKQNRALRKKI